MRRTVNIWANRNKSRRNGLASLLAVVNGQTSDDGVVDLAIHLLNQQSGRLYILYVIEVSRRLPIDAEIPDEAARGEEILQRYQERTAEYRFETHAEILQSRRTGFAVVQEAVDRAVDAIVLGAPYKYVHGSFSPGDTAAYVLKNAPCRVVLSRDVVPSQGAANSQKPAGAAAQR